MGSSRAVGVRPPLVAVLVVTAVVMMSECRAGRVFFPGPSIGPVPPSLWQSLHTLRQARRLDGKDDGAPELRAAGVRIGQKYSDLEQRPLLESPPQPQHDGGLQPLQGGDMEHLQPLEPLDVSETVETRGGFDGQQNDSPLLPPIEDVEPRRDSDSLQNLAPLPLFLTAESGGAKQPFSDAQTVTTTLDFNSFNGGQRPGEFVSFGDGQLRSDPASSGYSAPDPEDIITLDEAADLSQAVLVTGQVPEGVVYAATTVEDVNFHEEPGQHHLPSQEGQLPRRPDLQSSASILDSKSVQGPEQPQSFHRLHHTPRDSVRTHPTVISAADEPLQSDRNLLNLLVTQGVLRPVGRVRVARLRLVTDAGEDGQKVEQSVFFAPARSDDGEVVVELDVAEERSGDVTDGRRRYREVTNEAALPGLKNIHKEARYKTEDGDEEGEQTKADIDDERERVLNSNIVPILSEKEVFDRLVTPRASSSSTIAGSGSGAVSEPDDEPADIELVVEEVKRRRWPVATPRGESLAARLTELGSRVSRQGVWGRRLSGATPRDRDGEQQDGRHDGWQRRIDDGEPVFIDTDVRDSTYDLDTEGSERHEEVIELDGERNTIHDVLPALDELDGQRAEDMADLGERDNEDKEVVEEVDHEGNVRWKATSRTTQPTRTDILPERTVSFRTDNSTEKDEDMGPPQLVAELHDCPELGGSITLECRVKNAPEHQEIKRFWWMRRHFDGEDNAVRDELMAVDGVSTHTSDNTSVQQVAPGHQRLTVSAVAAADTGLYMCQAGWDDILQEVEMLVFLCH